ncbi:MAG: BatD family protein [Xanthomonadales bacterium]|nr:BatD family protein [Xanthomonadales bacterium]
MPKQYFYRAATISLCLLLIAWATGLQAEVTASLDRNSIVKGETITLVVQTNDPQQNLDPNLDALQDDFILLDRRSETQMSIVNGRQSAVMRLLITLEPKREGELVIPPLQLGSQSTQPLKVQVDAAPELPEGEMPPVFIELEIEPKDGPYYVHAQLRLTVRVFYLANLTEAAITPPEPANAAVRLLDEVPFQAERGDQRYRVLERHYAVFPERSGPLQIPAMTLTGRLVERRSDRLWQPSVRGRRIEAASEPVDLDILPRPASFTGDSWLPARQLQASQNISASETPTVGEPITRTIILDAVGLEENMLTEPTQSEIAGARIYPDQPQGITRDDGRWVLGHKEFRYAVVPEEAGELVLPELKLQWWDTVNNRQQTATLPEQRLTISPSSLQIPEPSAAVTNAASQQNLQGIPAVDGQGVKSIWRALTGVFAVLWLMTLFFLLRQRQAGPKVVSAAEQISLAENELLKEFQRGCEAADAGKARLALSHWLKRFGPPELRGSLVEFARELDDPLLAARLRELHAVGFQADGSSHWEAAGTWAAFKAWQQFEQQKDRATASSVTDLYARPQA